MLHFYGMREGAICALVLCLTIPAQAQNRQGGKKSAGQNAAASGGGQCQKGQSQGSGTLTSATRTPNMRTPILGTPNLSTPNTGFPTTGFPTIGFPSTANPGKNTTTPISGAGLPQMPIGNPFLALPQTQTAQSPTQTAAAQLTQYLQALQNLATQQTDATLQQAIVNSSNPYVRTAAAQEIFRRQGSDTSSSAQ